ncbi:MAG: N,N-dimethylformamidase beta subunit family domain-containing protein [Candidatus Phaeomarinobacter sp.]
MSQPWFYPDTVSAEAVETVRIFATSPQSPCVLTVSYVGRETIPVATYDAIDVGHHDIPLNADTKGCDWPEAFSFTVGDEWRSGYYDLQLTTPDGGKSHHFICVRKAKSVPKADGVLVLSTNTYHSYNYWGGSNSYAHVEKLMAGEVNEEQSRSGAIGVLSRRRPFAQGMLVPPPGAPRLINLNPRKVGEPGFPGNVEWFMEHRPSPYDGAACFVDKWEHKFVAWCDEQGYELDVITDHDFERGEDVLDGYKSVFLVGHSEYWSAKGRDAVEAYVAKGGNLAVFSGNTCYWKVRWEDDGDTMIAHKWQGEENDPKWMDPATRKDATHLWSHPAFERPEAEMIGLSFLYGGYHRLGLCVARGNAGMTVYDDQHWAVADTDLYYGDVIGSDIPFVGYENDGCPIKFGPSGLPIPDGGLGVPESFQIIAFTPATLAEDERNPYPPIIPREKVDVLSTIAFGSDDADTQQKLMRGQAVMGTFKAGGGKSEGGEVFNSGTTEWAHGLDAGDPFIEKITHNVMARFGVTKADG